MFWCQLFSPHASVLLLHFLICSAHFVILEVFGLLDQLDRVLSLQSLASIHNLINNIATWPSALVLCGPWPPRVRSNPTSCYKFSENSHGISFWFWGNHSFEKPKMNLSHSLWNGCMALPRREGLKRWLELDTGTQILIWDGNVQFKRAWDSRIVLSPTAPLKNRILTRASSMNTFETFLHCPVSIVLC
jgi:hypothetical protein